MTVNLPVRTDFAPGKIMLLCGKIASGKSYYAKQLLAHSPAVLLSMDELFEICELDFFNAFHSSLYSKLQRYLYAKAADLTKCGVNVIMDSGFWSRKERTFVSRLLSDYGVSFEWYYIDADDDTWHKNISQRNHLAKQEGYEQFLIDEKRIEEITQTFEIPTPNEIDVWVHNHRNEYA